MTTANTAPSTQRRAVVIGASMAGLVTARVLADHVDEVVLLDRDRFEDGPAHRRFVPQSHHAHGLLSPGRDALVRLFPGWDREVELAAGNAGDVDPESAISLVRGENVVPLPAWWAGGVLASRALIEFTVRERVAALPNVRLVQGVTVRGLRLDATGSRVDGVVATDGEHDADLVVDASGRRSALPDWLEAEGYERPHAEVVHSNVDYASCFVRLDDGFEPASAVLLGGQGAHGETAGGVFIRVEDRLVHCTFGTIGPGTERPPLDPEGYRAFADRMGSPAFAEILDRSTPATEIRPYRVTTNRFLRYDRISRPLRGIVPLGDAVCAFNPAYGQGMSVAAASALALGRTIAADGSTTAPGFEQRAARAIAAEVRPAWALAVSEDVRFGCATEGLPARRFGRAAGWYQERLERAAVHDPELALVLGDVVQLRRPMSAFGSPRVVARTLVPRRRRWAPVPATTPGAGTGAPSPGAAHTDAPSSGFVTGHSTLGPVVLHHGELGPRDRETVLFLHGWPDLWFSWEPLMRTVADAGFHAFAPDQRGYGRSTKPPRVADYGLETLAGDVAALIERNDLGRVHLVGHDWGAAVSWTLAASRPDLLRSLTVIDVPHPAVMIDGLTRRPAQMLRSWYMALFQVPGLAEALLGARGAAPQAGLLAAGAGLDRRDLARYREQWRNPDAVRAPLNWYRALGRSLLTDRDATRRLADRPIDVPTQVLWGAKDPAFAPGSAEASAERVGAELHVFPDAGHWPQNDARDEVARLMTSWLARHTGARAAGPVVGATA